MPMMKAIQVNSPGSDFELVRKEIPEPRENEILLKVQSCGICRGDAVVKEGHFPGITYPRVPGHEVVGIVDKSGSKVVNWKAGQRVGVGWHGGHCFHCSACRKGEFGACEHSLVTGLSIDGGYAEYMVIGEEVPALIPDELSSAEAAPLLCAGRTTFSALQSCRAKGGDLVAIHGLGGLGHLAVQYAVKLGFKTVVLSRGTQKEELAYKLGAHKYIDTSAVDAVKELQKMGGAQMILGTAPNSKAIAQMIGGLKANGEYIIVTGVSDMMEISPSILLRGGRSIRGWVGGNLEDTIRFSTLVGVTPMVEVFPLEQAAAAYEKMMSSKVHFRAVLKISE